MKRLFASWLQAKRYFNIVWMWCVPKATRLEFCDVCMMSSLHFQFACIESIQWKSSLIEPSFLHSSMLKFNKKKNKNTPTFNAQFYNWREGHGVLKQKISMQGKDLESTNAAVQPRLGHRKTSTVSQMWHIWVTPKNAFRYSCKCFVVTFSSFRLQLFWQAK